MKNDPVYATPEEVSDRLNERTPKNNDKRDDNLTPRIDAREFYEGMLPGGEMNDSLPKREDCDECATFAEKAKFDEEIWGK